MFSSSHFTIQTSEGETFTASKYRLESPYFGLHLYNALWKIGIMQAFPHSSNHSPLQGWEIIDAVQVTSALHTLKWALSHAFFLKIPGRFEIIYCPCWLDHFFCSSYTEMLYYFSRDDLGVEFFLFQLDYFQFLLCILHGYHIILVPTHSIVTTGSIYVRLERQNGKKFSRWERGQFSNAKAIR